MILEFLWEHMTWICMLVFIIVIAAIFIDKDWNKFEDNLDKMFRDYEERKRKGESE